MGRAVLVIWIAIILILLILYFFFPEVFRHVFQYPGPGSPYVNTPQG